MCHSQVSTLPRPGPTRPPARTAPVVPNRGRERHPHDGSRTCLEARQAIPCLDADDDETEIPTATRRFTVMETLSGLPDDSREADEKEEERRVRDLRGRVKVARAVVSTMPGIAEVLARDWRRAAAFYARLGVTERMIRQGVPLSSDDSADAVSSPHLRMLRGSFAGGRTE